MHTGKWTNHRLIYIILTPFFIYNINKSMLNFWGKKYWLHCVQCCLWILQYCLMCISFRLGFIYFFYLQGILAHIGKIRSNLCFKLIFLGIVSNTSKYDWKFTTFLSILIKKLAKISLPNFFNKIIPMLFILFWRMTASD